MKKLALFLSILLTISLFFSLSPLPVNAQTPISGRVSRDLPQPTPDTNQTTFRGGRYGEQVIFSIPPTKHFLADEGSYYVATNPTMGTSIAHVILAAFDDTKQYIYLRNTESSTNTNAKRIYLDYIKLLVKVVPPSAVEWGYVGIVDYGVARRTSGGNLITPVSPNGDCSKPSIATIYVGPVVTVAGTSPRYVARGRWRGVIPTIYDEYVIQFGGLEGGGSMAAAAASGRAVSAAPPVVIGPQQNFCLNIFGTGNITTASEYEFEIGYWER